MQRRWHVEDWQAAASERRSLLIAHLGPRVHSQPVGEPKPKLLLSSTERPAQVKLDYT